MGFQKLFRRRISRKDLNKPPTAVGWDFRLLYVARFIPTVRPFASSKVPVGARIAAAPQVAFVAFARKLRKAALPHLAKTRFVVRQTLVWLCCLSIVFSTFLAGPISAQENSSPDTPLVLGQTFSQQLKVNETRFYSLQLEQDYVAFVACEAKQIDVRLRVYVPGAAPLARTQDNLGEGGAEIVSFMANQSGVVRLEIIGLRSAAGEGSYTLTLRTVRRVQKDDRERLAADQLIADASVFVREGTAASRRQAVEKFQTAIPLLENANDKARLAMVFNRLGRNYNLMGRRLEAIENYQKSLSIRREIGDRVGQASVLADIGFSHSLAGEFQLALDYYSESMTIRRALNNPRLEAQLLYQIGNLHTQLGEPKKALDYFAQALPVIRANGQKISEARILNNMGAAYFSLGQLEDAAASLNQCLELQRSSGRLVIRNVVWHLAIVYFNMGQLQKSRELFQEALDLEQKQGDSPNRGNIFLGLGEVNYRLRNLEKAQVLLRQALPLMHATNNATGEARVHYWLARIESDNQRLDTALAQIQAAIEIVETVRSRIGSQEFRASFFATVEPYYDFYVAILWQLNRQHPQAGFDEQALLVAERSRAKGLIELLNEAQIDIHQGASAELITRQRELQKQLNARAAAQPLLLTDDATSEQNAESNKEIEETTRALLEVEAQIRRQSPHYAALTQPQTFSFKEIQATLDANTVLLEYRLGEPASFLWAVTKTDLQMFELPGRSRIEPLARRVYQLMSTRNATPGARQASQPAKANQEDEFRDVTAQLSRLLLGPVAPKLQSERLLIVADGASSVSTLWRIAGTERVWSPESGERVWSRESRVESPRC